MIEQHSSLSEKFFKKGLWLYLFSFIIAPIGYIIKIIISGELQVEEIGILYGIISLITLLATYNDLGMSESLKFFVPKFITEKRYDKVKSILFYAIFLQILTSIIIAGLLYFGSTFIASHYFKTQAAIQILQIFAFFFIGLNLFQTITIFFLSVQDTFYSKISDLLRVLFTLLFVIYIFVFDTSSLINFSYAWLFSLYLGILIALYFLYIKYYKKFFKNEKIILDISLIKQIGKYSSIIILSSSAGTILGQMDMQMIIYMLGTQSAGYYTNYLSIIGLAFILIGPIFLLLLPLFSELHSKKEYTKIKTIKGVLTKNFLAIGIALNLLFFIFSEQIAYILFGEKFIISGIILKYSVLFLIFNFLLQLNFNILAGVGRLGVRVKILSIALVFNFVLNFILIQYIGMQGAALATGFGWVLIYIMSEISLGKSFFIKINYIFLFKNICFALLLGCISYMYVVPLFEELSRFQALLYLSIYSSIYFLCFSYINRTDLLYFYKEIFKRNHAKNTK